MPVAAFVKTSFSKNASVIGVRVKPGATAFARIPCSAQSIASERVRAATAPFAAVYAACCGSETSAACEATLTIAPRARPEEREARLAGVHRAEHVDLVGAPEVVGGQFVGRQVLGQDAGGVDEHVESPVCQLDLAAKRSRAARSVTSTGSAPPRSATVTRRAALARAGRATASPIPDAPPVTTATAPSSPPIVRCSGHVSSLSKTSSGIERGDERVRDVDDLGELQVDAGEQRQ